MEKYKREIERKNGIMETRIPRGSAMCRDVAEFQDRGGRNITYFFLVKIQINIHLY